MTGIDTPLTGLTILVTRPPGQAQGLCERLEALGGHCVRLPLLDIVANDLPTAEPAHPQSDVVIFTSTNAVRHGLSLIRCGTTHATRFVAVGSATAAALADSGISEVLVPERRDSEGLLALPLLQRAEQPQASPLRVTVVKGVGGRQKLVDELLARKHDVRVMDAYQRRRLTPEPEALTDAVARCDLAVVTSGESLQHLAALSASAQMPETLDMQLVLPSDRVVQMANHAGFRQPPLVPVAMGDPEIVDVILDWHRSRSSNTASNNMTESERGDPHTEAPNPTDASESADSREPADNTPAAAEVAAPSPAVEDTIPPSEPEPEPEPEPESEPAPVRGARAALVFAVLSFLIGSVALAGVVYMWLEGQKATESTATRVAGLLSDQSSQRNEIDSIAAVLPDLVENQQQVEASLRSQAGAVGGLDGRLAAVEVTTSGLAKRVEGGKRTWQTAEIEHLLLVANDRLQLQADVASALKALTVADQRLNTLADPRYFDVRKQIASETAALRAVRLPDLQSASLTLSSLGERIPNLPLKNDTPREFVVGDVAGGAGEAIRAADPTSPEWWQKLGKSLKVTLDSMFSIRREDERASPMLPPQHEFFLLQNLALKVESARLALLQRDTATFRSSIDIANRWLTRHFSLDDPSVAAVAADFERLATLELQPQLPDISRSLQLLRNKAAAVE